MTKYKGTRGLGHGKQKPVLLSENRFLSALYRLWATQITLKQFHLNRFC